ncbi:MAG: M42 family metallopeptidase [Symbiobacteriaceae bacterium]|nr:M42 family metallopeptidase [Symbiobacteriaceae bacterium]
MTICELKDLTKRICEPYSPAGDEAIIAEVIGKEIEGLGLDISIDALGNLIAHKKGTGPKVMLAAHMDEIGVIITHIEEKGFLRFASIGGQRPPSMLSQRCHFANGTIGVFASEPIEPGQQMELSKMYIDIGCYTREEALQKVKVGDMAAYYGECIDLGKVMVSKALDDRIACVVLIGVLQQLKDKELPNDCYFVFTVQEEVGLRGARTSAFAIDPDYGIAVDVTGTGDTPKARVMEVSLGKGPTVKVKDASVICHPKVRRFMAEVAEKHEIPYQLEVLESGGTDSGAIHLTKAGVPSGVMSIPWRHGHSASEMVDMDDVANGIKLLSAILESEFPK